MFDHEQSSHGIPKPLCFISRFQFVKIPPIDTFMDQEYPKIYHHDCNINSFSSEPVVFQSTYLYHLNTKNKNDVFGKCI